MNNNEIYNLKRHKIVCLSIRIRDGQTSSGDDKSFRQITQKLKDLIEPRVRSGQMVVKQLEDTEPSFRLYFFMRHTTNIELMKMFPQIIYLVFDWKKNDYTHVDIHGTPTACLSPECIMKPVRHFLTPHTLHENTRNLMEFFDRVTNSADTEKKLDSLQQSILKIANDIGEENVKVHIFGSRMTGLAEWKSDVDIYVETGDTFCDGIDFSSQAKLVKRFGETMRVQPNLYSNITPITSSGVMAVLRFRHIESDLQCDLTFGNGISVTNCKLVKTYLEIDPRVKYVICGLKYWMEATAQKIHFLSCAQTWMVLFYLMQKKVVPSVNELKSRSIDQQTLLIEGWSCCAPDIEDVEWISECEASREMLLNDFFAFYGNISQLQYKILCPSRGEMIDKIAYMNECKSKYTSSKFDGIMRDFRGPLCILDPFVKTKNLNRFTRYCEAAYCTFIEYCRETNLLDNF